MEKSTTDIVLGYYRERLPLSLSISEYGQAAFESYELKMKLFVTETKVMHSYIRKLKEHAEKMSNAKA